MPEISIPHNWQPRPYQLSVWSYLEGGGKRAVEVWHRRAGKDEVCLHWAAVAAHERVGTYWHMLPQASQARKAIWTAINPRTGLKRIDEAFPHELRARTRDQEMFIEFKSGSTWQVLGSDNYNSLVGSPPVGVVFSEYALADPNAWAYLRPILADNGGWALFISTPRGRNHLASLYEMARQDPAWHAEVLTVETTGAIAPEIIAQERREIAAERGEEEAEQIISQEYGCSFAAAMPGAYYGKTLEKAQAEGRVCRFLPEPGIRVDTAWDLGINDAMSVWFVQEVGREFRVVDYEEGHGMGVEDWARVLDKRGYLYGRHWMPHDAARRELGTGRDVKSSFERVGVKPIEIVQRARDGAEVIQGIHAGRALMAKAYFETEKTRRGREALAQYRSEYDETKRVFSNRPVHDWTSHAADAWRTLAMGWKPKLSQARGATTFAGMSVRP